MNDTERQGRDAVQGRHLDLMLAENLGAQQPPDVAMRTLTALRKARARRPGALLQVACALLGLGVVVAFGLLVRAGDADVAQRPPLGPEVAVRTLAEIEQLPADTDNVRLHLHTADAVRGLVRLRGLRRLDASFDAPRNIQNRREGRPVFFPAGADALGMLTSLEELDLSGHAPITGLASLATLSRLRSLRIFCAWIEPASLAVVKQLPRLEHFELQATLTLDEAAPWIDMRDPEHGLASFAAAGRLRSLTLTACIVDAAGIRALADNPLERLELYALNRRQREVRVDTSLDAAAYVPVGRIATLRELAFRETVSEELFAGLRELPHLRVLDLGSADGLRGRAIGEALAAIPRIERLSVGGSDVDTAALLALTKSPAVVDLTLGGSAWCTDDVIVEVAKMPNLRRLTMPIVPGFTDQGLAPLADTRLEFVRLQWAKDLTSAALLHMPETLRAIAVDGHMLDEEALAHLSQVTDWSIDFDGRMKLGLVSALVEGPVKDHIERLDLCGDLGQLGALAPLAALPKLRLLELGRCMGEVPAEDLRAFAEAGVRVVPPMELVTEETVTELTVDEIVGEVGGGR